MKIWILCFLIIAGLAAYQNSFTAAFVFDDRRLVVENEFIRNALSTRPFLNLTLVINHALHGLHVFGYHVVNLLIHLLAGLTLFGIVRRTFLNINFPLPSGERIKVRGKGPHPHPNPLPERERGIRGDASGLAFTIALLWLLHPLQTQSVTYLIQRGESLMGLFYLLTLYSVIRSNIPSPQPSPLGGEEKMRGRVRGWPLVAVFSCALGMATKEVMVTAPLLTLLYDRIFLSSSFKETFQKRKFLYLGLFATWIIVVITNSWILNPNPTVPASVGFGLKYLTPLEYALTQPGVILHYLGLSFFPHPLVIDYGWPLVKGWNEILIPSLVVGTLLLLTLWALRFWPPLGFLGAWFFLILAPTSSFIPIVDLAFEHRMYLPLASVITLTVLLGYHLLQNQPLLRKGSVLLLATTLGTFTFLRNQDYQSEIRIWQDTVEKRPGNWRAFNNLGKALENEGRLEEAAQALTRALALAPNYVEAHNNLGNVLTAQGKVEEAIFHYQEALRIYPHFAKAHYNLGNALAKQGKLGEALPHYEQAVRIDPFYAKARYNLATVLAKEGRLKEAIHHYTELLRLKPDYPDVQKNLFIIQEEQSNRLAKNEAPLA